MAFEIPFKENFDPESQIEVLNFQDKLFYPKTLLQFVFPKSSLTKMILPQIVNSCLLQHGFPHTLQMIVLHNKTIAIP